MSKPFLDMSKAFERVNHSLLLDKLKNKGIPEFIINIYKSIFRDSEIQVCYNNCMSNSWNIARGIRQGGVTSALLFNIYIDEILSKMKDLNIGCRMGINKVNVQAYADDLVLLSPTSSGLQKLIYYLSDLLDIHELKINTDKTKVVIFIKKIVRQQFEFKLNDKILEVVDHIKYLGCILNNKLCDEFDIDKCNRSFNISFGFLFRKFYQLTVKCF